MDDQVLFMTTCMETWMVSDHAAMTDPLRRQIPNLGVAASGEPVPRPVKPEEPNGQSLTYRE